MNISIKTDTIHVTIEECDYSPEVLLALLRELGVTTLREPQKAQLSTPGEKDTRAIVRPLRKVTSTLPSSCEVTVTCEEEPGEVVILGESDGEY